VLGLAEGLRAKGHLVSILEYASDRPRVRVDDGISIMSLPRAFYPRLLRPSSWLPFVRCVWQLHRILRRVRPEVISVQFPTWQSVPLVALSLIPHKWRIAVTLRGSDIRSIPTTQPRLVQWQEALLRRADVVTAVSESLRSDALALYPFLREKIRVIYNAPNPSFFDNNTVEASLIGKERFILFVGAILKVKGVDVLLRAWKLVQDRGQPVCLIVVGEGAELESMVALCEELRITASVRFVGSRSQDDLRNLYCTAELIVIPSRAEGLPRVGLEAGACGSICVASDVGGLAEVVQDGVTGFLVSPESPTALSQAILRAMELPPSERRRISFAAKDRVRRLFGYDKMVRSYEQLFLSLRC
jgi:glycosyltransferase involved in cell wall biosynthesis